MYVVSKILTPGIGTPILILSRSATRDKLNRRMQEQKHIERHACSYPRLGCVVCSPTSYNYGVYGGDELVTWVVPTEESIGSFPSKPPLFLSSVVLLL
jgi:hypothetical protein